MGGGTEIESGYQTAFSLLINSSTISLALGSAFTKADFSIRQILLGLTLFTLVAPIAILIGLGLGEDGMHALVNVTLLALSTGMYLYYACSEVFVKEFQDKG